MGKAIYGDISSRQYLLGLCTGLVPAAFVAASVSVGHLVQIGPECVDIALQVGIEAQRRSREIESGLEDWTRAITKISLDQAQTILDKFNFDNVCTCFRVPRVVVADQVRLYPDIAKFTLAQWEIAPG